MLNTKPIPRYSHPPLIGAYSYKMTSLLSVTPTKRGSIKQHPQQASLMKTQLAYQNENSNSFSNIDDIHFNNKSKQLNSIKAYVKDTHKLLLSKDKQKQDNSVLSPPSTTHPLYTKRKSAKVKNRKISSNDIKSIFTHNKEVKHDEYSITYENDIGVNHMTMMTTNKDDANQIGTYMKNVSLQQSYVKKRPNNRSFIRMSSTCVASNANASNVNHNVRCSNDNNGNISFITNMNASHVVYNNTNNNAMKSQMHNNTQQPQLHTHMTMHVPLYNDEIEEYFNYEDEKQQELTKEEKDIYGNREMKGYQKVKLLGKGGCGIVWLSIDKNTKRECAVKQISKKGNPLFTSSNISIAKNEISILTSLTSTVCESTAHNANNNIVHIYNSYEDKSDIWFSFEKGGKSLSALSFKIKGSFLKSERIYTIQKGAFLKHLFSSSILHFKHLITQLLHAVHFINANGVIHADIKPENILIEYTLHPSFAITSVKVIDFGSAFYINNPSSINSNTPEYLCPEVTAFMEGNTKNKNKFWSNINKYPSCIDVWSLGVTILELVVLCPVWMSYKAKVIVNGKSAIGMGLFGFKGRDGKKIHQKQIEVVANLKAIISKSVMNKYSEVERERFEDLLSRMLSINYKNRITPLEALKHPFLKQFPINKSNYNTYY